MISKPLDSTRFAVRFTNTKVDNAARKFGYIVLVDEQTKAVMRITDIADYVLYCVPKDIYIGAHGDEALYAVVQFLNYIFIDCNDVFHIDSICDVTKEMVASFISDYASGKITKKDVSHKSIDKKRAVVSTFLETLCKSDIEMKHIRPGSLIRTKVIRTSNYIVKTIPEYTIKIRYPKRDNPIQAVNRDMPFSIMERFIKVSEIYDPEITFAIVLMAYVGLRLGEVCNVRQVESCLGKGIRFLYGRPLVQLINGEHTVRSICESIEIDLRDTLPLRYDGISVGGIKRPRMQRVYSGFTSIVYTYYEKHLKLIKNKNLEPSLPMFTSTRKDKNSGKYLALTKSALYLRIMRLFDNYLLPSLETDSDPDLQQFFYSMEYHSWGPHAFRHWFTCFLVVRCGVDEVTLQTLRGDKSPDSSKIYLERKGELERIYRGASETLGNRISEEHI